MTFHKCVLLFACVLPVSVALHGQATESSITKQISGLRAVPDAQRPAATTKIAIEIRTLPAGLPKLNLAIALSHLSTEGDPGSETLQAVADTLAQAVSQCPQEAKGDRPPEPYMELAKLARYEHITTDLKDPVLDKADAVLAADEADVQKADFTLKDLHGKKVTLSVLRGKIVLVNFWATWCPPCRKEMSDLDLIYTHYEQEGLVVLSLTSEEGFVVNNFITQAQYHPPVLLDDGGKVAKQFHVDGIPKTFVFDRDGKLVVESIDMRTQRQFFAMLAQAGLQPLGSK
ncbi:MAG: TlpA disulfide reductase family protein [Acidobacteriaceae bacterium]|jgi:peroxiredoxin